MNNIQLILNLNVSVHKETSKYKSYGIGKHRKPTNLHN